MRNRVVLVAAVMAFCFGTSVAFAQGGGGKSAKSDKSAKSMKSAPPPRARRADGTQGASGSSRPTGARRHRAPQSA